MKTLNAMQLRQYDGEGFWDGLICGASAGYIVFALLSPDPLSKLGLARAGVMAVGSCGSAFF